MYRDLLQYDLRMADEHMIALGINNIKYPWSITEDEFHFIKGYVAMRRYTSGFVLGTGFGVSSCAVGLGLQTAGGKLISVDAYIEERLHEVGNYIGRKEKHPDGYGLVIATKLRKHFGLDNTVDFQVGWSPDDIPTILGDRKLDFVFIDAAPYESNLLADIGTIKDRMVPPFTVMIHDTHAFSKKCIEVIANWFKTEMVLPRLPKTWNLGYFARSE